MHRLLWFACGSCLAWLAACSHEPRHEALGHGRFEQLQLSVPDAPKSAVLLLAGSADQAQVDALAAKLAKRDALVVRIDAAAFQRLLDETPGGCVFPSGDLDNLSRFIQAYVKFPGYQSAILLGVGVGAGLAAGALNQAPPGTFAGALVFDYCGDSALRVPLCPREASGEGSAAPALVRLSSNERGCPAGTPAAYAEPAPGSAGFDAAFDALAASAKAHGTAAPTSMSDLPLIEVEASGSGAPGVFGVFLSGDGGWAGFDEKLSAQLAEQGLPIVGLDSLRYFWRARTPESTTTDLDRVIKHYQAAWKRKRVVLIGFSQGADVLPFILNRLPPMTRAAVTGAVAMSISTKASFEFHLSNWIGDSGDRPTLPEMQKLGKDPIVYVCGEDDADAICPQLTPEAFNVISLPGSHHFNDAYAPLSAIILTPLEPH